MITLNLKSLVGRLNPTVRNSLEGAAGLAMSRAHYEVEIEHWLLKLIEEGDTDIVAILERFEVNMAHLARDLTNVLDRFKNGSSRPPSLSPALVDLAKEAWLLASVEYGHAQVTSGHLLAAMMLDEGFHRQLGESSKELKDIPGESAKEMARATVGTTSESTTILSEGGSAVDSGEAAAAGGAPTKTPSLDKFTINLTERAAQGKIDPVLGRDGEIRQLVDILSRRRQNNPILTGEAGVGKTAVVEGFALRIAQNDVPETLQGVVVRTLDLGLLQAGASVKGEFENRLKSVIDEVKASPVPIIMFIDEAHTLIGAGGKEGQGDAANLMKPALARGEMRTIAATTWAEYKKYFERDPALTRRFQVVKVEEPDEDTAIEMMRGIAKSLESHHKTRILDEAIIEAVKLSHRYIAGRQLPDKSVSLLDTACAKVSLSLGTTPAAIEDARRHIDQCTRNIQMLEREDATSGGCQERITELTESKANEEARLEDLNAQWDKEKDLVKQIREVREKIEADFLAKLAPAAEGEENAEEKPAQLSAEELAELKTQLQGLTEQLNEVQGEAPLMQPVVDGQAVAEVVGQWTGIPVGRMVSDEMANVLNLADRLNARVIGQDHALEAIAQSIRTSRAGLRDPRKPIGVFFMVGPSGTGKTETALALSEMLYGGEHNVTTINMSEFKEEHKVSMLVGSPPGYVGYGEGGVLTEAVRRKPYSIVLLDEMEKAHHGVQDIFYNVFDKGTIKDGEGRDIDFKNTIIIMTSNAGEEHIRAICEASEEKPEPDVILDNFRPELLNWFKPAFLGRCDIIPYYPLDDENLITICGLNMNRIEKRVREHYGAGFSYHGDVPLHIVARSQEVDTGARNIEHIISRTLLPELASECLNRMAEGEEIKNIHINVDEEGSFSYELS